jgi:hypothetical protein
MLKPPERPSHAASTPLRILREPLFHFLIIGALIFAFHAWVTPKTAQETAYRDRIIVTSGRVEQLAQVFAKTWQRSPTTSELNGLIEAFVKEEVYYREATRLGLDRDDTLIRRRMQQKMVFLSEPGDEALQATDAQLQAYLEAKRAFFQVDPRIAFEQVFINPRAEGEPADARARTLLAKLRGAPADMDAAALGDRTLLDHATPLTSAAEISRSFGQDFADALTRLPRKEWTGPLRSPFGLHLLRITDYREAYDPPLADIREAVLLKWRAEQREAFIAAEYERLRAQYEVVLPFDDLQATPKMSSTR